MRRAWHEYTEYRVLLGGTGQWSGVYDSFAAALEYAERSVRFDIRARVRVVPHYIQKYAGDDEWTTVRTIDGTDLDRPL